MWLDLGSWRRDEAGEKLVERWTSLWIVVSNVRACQEVAVDLELLGGKGGISKIWMQETEYWEVQTEFNVDDAYECVLAAIVENSDLLDVHACQNIWLHALVERYLQSTMRTDYITSIWESMFI